MTESGKNQLVRIQTGTVQVEGMLQVPAEPIGIVVFAHGSGSSRFSPRNNHVAGELRKARIGTFLIDLLTPQEDEIYRTRFDIALLTQRLHAAVDWLRHSPASDSLPIGLFGASTGAAAALQMAATLDDDIAAIVSRGGRPDLAGQAALEKVQAPTLLIVGGADPAVIDLNRIAYEMLQCEKQLEIIPGATHLFEERGKLAAVAALASDWFGRHFIHANNRQRPSHMSAPDRK